MAAPLRRLSGDDPERQSAVVVDRDIATDAPDEDLVAAGGLRSQRVFVIGWIILDDDAGHRGEQLARPFGRDRIARLDVDRLRVADEDRDADGGARDPQVRQAQDLAALVDDLPLFLGVAIRQEDVDLRQGIEGDRVGIDRGRLRLAADMRPDLALELGQRVRAGARDRLVGVDDDALEADRVAQRHQDRGELHRRTVRVGDDARMALEVVRVDLRDDERDVRVHPPGGRIVDDRGSMGHRGRCQLHGDVRAGREERDVHALERLRHGLADLEIAAVDETFRPADRPEASRRSSPTGNSRSLRIWIIVRPTTPVAPTTATVRGLWFIREMAPLAHTLIRARSEYTSEPCSVRLRLRPMPDNERAAGVPAAR